VKKIKVVFLIIFLGTSALPVRGDDFISSPIGQELVKLGLKFLNNPGDFLFNLHTDNEDFTPVVVGRHGAIRWNFYPTTFPGTWPGLNLKVKVLSDKPGSWPQVDLMMEYGRMLALDAMSGVGTSTSTVKPSLSDYTYGIVLTKSVSDDTRIFFGTKYSQVEMNLDLSEPVTFGTFSLQKMMVNVNDVLFTLGIENYYSKTSHVLATVAYGFKYKKLTSRIAFYHKHLELGFNIYPEGLFVVHPFMAWHWYF
jgi:hypothetical protein